MIDNFFIVYTTFNVIYAILVSRKGEIMYFDLQKFSSDVKQFRKVNKLTQSEFAKKLELDNNNLVSLFEQGNRAPSKKTFENYCRITGYCPENYWKSSEEETYSFLMRQIAESDKEILTETLEKIRIHEYLFALYARIKK